MTDPETRNAHGWLIVEIEDDQLVLLSKFSEKGGGEGRCTAELGYLIKDLEDLNQTFFFITKK